VNRLRRALSPDRGSAIAEFGLVAPLLILLALAIIQLALFQHVRNVLVDAAGQGARHGALHGSAHADGAQRTAQVIDGALGEGYPATVDVDSVSLDGAAAVRVTVTAQVPLLGLLGPAGSLEVSGHAVDENAL
jgi:Flp pilus assembly protein TadG